MHRRAIGPSRGERLVTLAARSETNHRAPAAERAASATEKDHFDPFTETLFALSAGGLLFGRVIRSRKIHVGGCCVGVCRSRALSSLLEGAVGCACCLFLGVDKVRPRALGPEQYSFSIGRQLLEYF